MSQDFESRARECTPKPIQTLVGARCPSCEALYRVEPNQGYECPCGGKFLVLGYAPGIPVVPILPLEGEG